METRDYLMRQFNQLGKVLGKILADLFEPDNTVTAHQSIEAINEQLITSLKIDIDSIIEIPPNELISKFKEEYEANFSNFEDMAEFLYQVAYLYQAQNEPDKAKSLFSQALVTYQYLLDNDDTFSLNTHQRIGEIASILS